MVICLAINFIECTPRTEDKMDYTLETENGVITGIVNNSRISEEINRIANDDVKYPEDYGFLILVPKEKINNIRYIQMAKNVGSDEYTIEIRIDDNKSFKHYQYFSNSKEEVMSIFLDFAENKKLPDLKEWEDVSGQYR